MAARRGAPQPHVEPVGMEGDAAVDRLEGARQQRIVEGRPFAEQAGRTVRRVLQCQGLVAFARQPSRAVVGAEYELRAPRTVEKAVETVDPQLRIRRSGGLPCGEIAAPGGGVGVAGRCGGERRLRTERKRSRRPEQQDRKHVAERSHGARYLSAASCSFRAAIFASASACLARSLATTFSGADCTNRSLESFFITEARNPS